MIDGKTRIPDLYLISSFFYNILLSVVGLSSPDDSSRYELLKNED